jgi:hypothetical protein
VVSAFAPRPAAMPLERLEIDREGCSYTTYTNSVISAALASV